MRRLFVGNFEFEHRLADVGRAVPARLQRLNAELASSWLAIANDGDRVWSPQAIAPEFWQHMAAAGLPRVTSVCGPLSAIVTDDDIVTPWGWDASLSAALPASARTTVPWEAVRRVNSRRWSAEREQAWGVGLPEAAICVSIEDVQTAIDRAARVSSRWVIKAEYGMSGRERILGSGTPTDDARQWITRRLQAGGVLFFEPWVECLAEAGVSFDVEEHACRLIGITPMLASAGGQYSGSSFWPAAEDDPRWSPALEVALRAAEDARAEGYRGPLGIDVMHYRTVEGELGIRPLQDVNGRWTMGRLSLGWRSRWNQLQDGLWWHGQRRDFDAGNPQRILGPESTLLRTSPESIAGTSAHHVSALVLRGSST